jgi:signal transduction histidine kinase/CheY-like chemotaxis protein
MIEGIWTFLSTEGFQPHGICLLWRRDILWAHLASDALIALAYFSIPVALVYFAMRRTDLVYRSVLFMFSSFIVACGLTHVMGIWTMFVPDYGVQAAVKVGTAAVSVFAASALWPLMPKLLALPSRRQLEVANAELEREIANRKGAEDSLRALYQELEERIRERTESLARANRELELARIAADQSNRAKSEFRATMSHEIRTPMNGVVGMLDLLKEEDLDARQRHFLEVAHDSAKDLVRIIDDILDCSRLEAGSLELETIAFDPRVLLAQVADLLREGAQKKGVALSTEVPADMPPLLLGDPTRVRQILFNLVGNAIKFTSDGEVVASLRYGPGRGDAPELAVDVRDTGIGIPAEVQARLFQRFSQADGTITRRYGGTGLGLAICKHLVTLMGGSIGMDSVEGRGSRFWFSVPFPVASGEAAPGPAAEPQRASTAPPAARILVAEDNSVNQLVISQYLKKMGHSSRIVGNGLEVLQTLEQEPFDVILMDVHMPGLDGVSVTRRIRASADEYSTIPIVALTARAMKGDREAFFAAGMDDCVTNPIDVRRLVEALGRVLANRRPPIDSQGCRRLA